MKIKKNKKHKPKKMYVSNQFCFFFEHLFCAFSKFRIHFWIPLGQNWNCVGHFVDFGRTWAAAPDCVCLHLWCARAMSMIPAADASASLTQKILKKGRIQKKHTIHPKRHATAPLRKFRQN